MKQGKASAAADPRDPGANAYAQEKHQHALHAVEAERTSELARDQIADENGLPGIAGGEDDGAGNIAVGQ